jgi:hypothetical protein
MILFSHDVEKLVKINEMICHILYLPFALIITAIFLILNIILMPIGYSVHTIRLLTSTMQQKGLYEMMMRVVLTA